ncbi:hypothetical protein IscW_ISCW005361 [Ixodes scapularis]|uniref:Uncharacterized protein n=1 Tax=Ixodes scapularis TaxID=6945 RepID=B7PKS2_IXOSC|nr:hypothetical protein IscW_ISCW005361 [Ixodes scapularis]|eukprot:XP_002434370.1 hypothetical protein IscW_ISCW005361 [Ixodes scapularis]
MFVQKSGAALSVSGARIAPAAILIQSCLITHCVEVQHRYGLLLISHNYGFSAAQTHDVSVQTDNAGKRSVRRKRCHAERIFKHEKQHFSGPSIGVVGTKLQGQQPQDTACHGKIDSRTSRSHQIDGGTEGSITGGKAAFLAELQRNAGCARRWRRNNHV